MKKLFCVALFLIGLSSGPVHASTLIGTNVTLIYSIGPNVVLGPVTTTSTDTFLVTGGVNITCPGGAFNACGILTSPTQTITVGANTLTWNYNSTQPSQFLVANPNKFDFENLFTGASIIGVSLSTNLAGLTLADVTFTANSVQINDSGLQLPAGNDFFTVTLTTAATPLPAALPLFAGGLGLIGLFARRRKRKGAAAAT